MPDLRSLRRRLDRALDDHAAADAVGRATRATCAKHDALREATGEWEAMRRRAQAIRREVVEHLDPLVDAFADACADNGIEVHHTADAADARATIEAIARDAGARTAVKAKTIVGEEIGVARALAAAGVDTVETDLGAFIVQLRGERPTHLTAPAIHLRADDVGHLFAARLGIDFTADAETLAAHARRVLRERFLRADIGITGANFGIVDSGGVVVVENEGNALLSAAAPRVHVAVIGIERLLPDLASLPLFLRLLCGSATGQRITSYVRWIGGPPVRPDGAMHVVLVDNGRRSLAARPEARELLHCIRCGACQNACPVYRRIGGAGYGSVYGGPIGATIAQTLEPDRAGLDALPFASTLCGACRDACPVAIDLPHHLLRLRAEANARGRVGPKRAAMRAFAAAARRPRAFALASRLVAAALPWSRWQRDRSSPRPVAGGFARAWARESSTTADAPTHHATTPALHAMSPDADGPHPLDARFVAAATAVAAEVVSERDPAAAAVDVAARLGDGTRVVVPADPALDRFAEAAARAGAVVTRGCDRDATALADAAITRARFGVAETGTIGLDPATLPDPLLAALPRTHVVVLPRAALHADLADALAARDADAREWLLVTGPSRTADIEKRLVLGAHGPRRLIVALVG